MKNYTCAQCEETSSQGTECCGTLMNLSRGQGVSASQDPEGGQGGDEDSLDEAGIGADDLEDEEDEDEDLVEEVTSEVAVAIDYDPEAEGFGIYDAEPEGTDKCDEDDEWN